MKVTLVPIGNARGIMLLQSVIDACGFGSQLELRVENATVVLSSADRPVRSGWDAAFAVMAATGDDAAIWPDVPEHTFDAEEWRW